MMSKGGGDVVQISAGILAGGRSSRIGQNKAFLPWRDSSFLEQTIAACRDFAPVLLSVDRAERFAGVPCPMVEDELQNFGPVEGIYQLLRASQTPYMLIVATDMPYLDSAFLARLAGRVTAQMEALVLRVHGQLEPLCSVYSKAALPVLAQMRRQQIHQIRVLYPQIRTAYVELAALGAPERLVENINTPDEYQALLHGKL